MSGSPTVIEFFVRECEDSQGRVAEGRGIASSQRRTIFRPVTDNGAFLRLGKLLH